MKKLLVSVLALSLSVQTAAQDSEETLTLPPLSTLNNRQLIDLAFDKERNWTEHPCDLGIPVFGELATRMPDNPRISVMRVYSEALCADQKKDFVLGLSKVQELEELDQEGDYADLGFYFSNRLDDANGLIARLQTLDDAQLSKLNPDRFWVWARTIRKNGKQPEFQELAFSWFVAGRFRNLNAELEGGVARAALTHAAETNRTDRVPELLGLIRSPVTFIGLLLERRYQNIWPEVEAYVGPNLKSVSDSYVDWTTSRLNNNDADRDRFSSAAHALHFAGRYEAAISLTEKIVPADGSPLALEEGDAWALNIRAYAYDALGRKQDADKVFDQLATIDRDKEGWVVNFVINRASRLIGQQRWEEGLDAATLARSVAEKHGSTYAKMIIARDFACLRNAMGQVDLAAPEIAFLKEHVSDSYTLAAEGLLCIGNRDEAAKLLIEGIRKPESRDILLEELQPAAFDLFYTPSGNPKPRDLLSENADLRSAFDEHARVIPPEFTPIAHLNRFK